MGNSNVFCQRDEKPDWLFVSCRCMRTRLTPTQILIPPLFFKLGTKTSESDLHMKDL